MESAKPRQITREEQWRITCHEAGHAIVAVKHRLPFQHVERGDGEYGVVELAENPVDDLNSENLVDDLKDRWSEDELLHWQEFYAGGAAAERLLFGSDRPYALRYDKRNHDQLESRRTDSRSDGFEEDIGSAIKLLDKVSIQNVAAKLEEKRKLSMEQVCELIGCTPPWELRL